MSEIDTQRDKVAKEIFGKSMTYNSLSAWSRMSVDATIANGSKSLSVAPEGLQGDSLHYRIATLEDQLSLAKKENNDLWEENEALKMELEDRREIKNED